MIMKSLSELYKLGLEFWHCQGDTYNSIFQELFKILSCLFISDTLEGGRKKEKKGGRKDRSKERKGKNSFDSVVKCVTSPFVNLDLQQYTCGAWSWGIGLKSIEESVRNISYLCWETELCLHYKTSKNRISKCSWKTCVKKYATHETQFLKKVSIRAYPL